MKRLGAVILVVVGIGLIALGLLFLIGAGGKAYRYAIGAAGLAVGAVAVGFGIRLFKQANQLTPDYIKAEILVLAERHNGEISESDLMAALGTRWPHALTPLSELLSKGTCRKRVVDGTDYYVFEDLQPRLTVRRCEFCDAEIPLDDTLTSCPNCGGTIKTGVQKVSLSKDDAYSMDE